MFLILAVFSGIMVALMIQLNGVLQETVGAVNSLMYIHLSGLAGASVLLFVLRKRLGGDERAGTPFFYLTAGMVGTAIVFLASLSFQKGGILMSLSGSLAGQTLAASVGESFYPQERARSSIIQRIVSPALLLPGSVIIGIKAGAAPCWILLSWLPGILLMFQQTMNAGNTKRWGTPRTVIFNYISALILIIPMFFFQSQQARAACELASQLPLLVVTGGGLIGVFSTGVIAFLLLKAPALVVVLGIYAGELGGGMLIDIVTGNPIAAEKIIGMALLVLGLGAGKINPDKAVSNRSGLR